MFFRKREDHSYVAVAMMFIIAGAFIFAFGTFSYLVNMFASLNFIAFPSVKIMGGLIIMALGYIQLELGLLRKK